MMKKKGWLLRGALLLVSAGVISGGWFAASRAPGQGESAAETVTAPELSGPAEESLRSAAPTRQPSRAPSLAPPSSARVSSSAASFSAAQATKPPTTARGPAPTRGSASGFHCPPSGKGKMVALTFDDGPRRSTTTEILDALEKYHANATFFCLGIHVEGNESVIERMLSLGCEVSSHSNEHKYLTQLSPAALQKDLTAANEALAKVIGQRPALLRPPFGSKSTSLLAQLDVPVILWSIDTQDWVYHDGVQRSDYQRQKDLEKVVNEALDLVEDGSIILMHDVFFFSADAAAEIIQRLTAQEWQLVTVSELFAAKGIPLEPGKSYYHA